MREAEDVEGMEVRVFAGVGGKPVPAEHSEVAGHGREGRLAANVFVQAAREGRTTEAMGAATWCESWPKRETYKKNTRIPQDMVCLVAPLSCTSRQKKTERGTFGKPDQCRKTDVRMAKKKAIILRDGAKDVVELKSSNPESFDERLQGHRGGCGDALGKTFCEGAECRPPQQRHSFEKKTD